ncbi:zinc-dependent alcohol dehydrogenase family protein [Actinoplanes sp. NPDC051470]|uniref:zinc-dependent alcohol dehydrogenase family protein n=1 Tax=unclassified Actinoplanes TaxID=2626549 RepID=UPI00341744A1
MRAVRYDGPRSFTVTDVPTPPVGPGDVRIAVQTVGVCGTDLHLHHGHFNAVFPFIPGHEMVGQVEEIGSNVAGVHPGELVTVNPNIYCGSCDYCLAGRLGLCGNSRGMGSSLPGFFAESVTVDQRQVFSVEGLDPDVAVFTEPTACAMHGVETLGVRPGSHALVIGAGPTGILLSQLIGSGGAASVTVADIAPAKLQTASRLGADLTIALTRDTAKSAETLLEAAPSGDGYDIVVEATGLTAIGDICVPLTRNGGTVLIYGVTRADETLSASPYDILRRGITIKGSYAEMTTFGAAVAALRTGRARTNEIITHRFPLDYYGQVLAALTNDPTAHKVVIDVR